MPTDRASVAPRHEPADGGFSLIEVMVAIVVIGTVMAAMAPFLVRSMVLVNDQAGEQVAVEVANDALERARAMDPSSLLSGRGKQRTEQQWATAPDEVDAYLATMRQAWDPMLPDTSPDGAQAPLPTRPNPVTIGGVAYQQHWYVGRCYQAKAPPSTGPVPVADCTAASAAATDVPYFRVVVAVTWSQQSCDGGECIYVASTLVSTASDPTFDTKRPPPTITDPDDQRGYVGVPGTDLTLAASGGWLPRTWSATGLPPGLSLAPGTGVISGTPTIAGSWTVTVQLSDRDGKTDDATFTWIVAAAPTLADPGDQTSRTGVAVTLPLAVTGGHQPMAWTATGLPAGLSINASTGVISGTSTVEQRTARPVTVTVVDARERSAAVTFDWQVLTPVRLANPGTQTFSSGSNAGNYALLASGGLPPYTWSNSGLPDGFTMDAQGRVIGTVTNGTRYVVQLSVTDSAGGTASITVLANVTPRTGELRVTSPTTDRTTAVRRQVNETAIAAGGSGRYTWSATGLPPGVTVTSGGRLGGRPTAAGRYVVTLTAQDSAGSRARMMFVWTVTP